MEDAEKAEAGRVRRGGSMRFDLWEYSTKNGEGSGGELGNSEEGIRVWRMMVRGRGARARRSGSRHV